MILPLNYLKTNPLDVNEKHVIKDYIRIQDYIRHLSESGFPPNSFCTDLLRLALYAILEVKGDVSASDIIFLLSYGKPKDFAVDDIKSENVRNYWERLYPKLFLSNFFLILFY